MMAALTEKEVFDCNNNWNSPSTSPQDAIIDGMNHIMSNNAIPKTEIMSRAMYDAYVELCEKYNKESE